MKAISSTSAGRPVAAARHRVVAVRPLTERVFELVVTRDDLAVLPGQHVTLGVESAGVNREYSVYTITPATLAFLIVIREGSVVSQALRCCAPGDSVALAGPFGAFTIADPGNAEQAYGFIAAGVGIAPFHAVVTAYPRLRYHLLHGVRRLADRYDYADYRAGSYTACVSREDGGDFQGRVTDYLAAHAVDSGWVYHICGGNTMVSETYDRLRRRGVPADNLRTEVFY